MATICHAVEAAENKFIEKLEDSEIPYQKKCSCSSKNSDSFKNALKIRQNLKVIKKPDDILLYLSNFIIIGCGCNFYVYE